MTKQNQITLAILLPVFNHIENTKACLENLKSGTSIESEFNFRIILIDDGSIDGTSDYVESFYPDIDILKGDGDLWWSGAVNLGARYAINELKVDYIILWNNDIRAEKDYFSKLIKVLSQVDHETIIGSKILVLENPDTMWSMGGYFHPTTGKYGMYGYYEKELEKYKKSIIVDWLTGMGTIIPRKVIETIGYWDNKNFPQYHGDSDFTYRAKLNGFKITVNPSLIIFNSVKSSGIEHEGSFKMLWKLMTDIRSKNNFKKNLKFLQLYAKSYKAYIPLVLICIKIFLGFFKWKVLNIIGFRRK